MKVLQVGSSLKGWSGIERYVECLSSGLLERGHEVSIAVTPGTDLERRAPGAKVAMPSRGKHDTAAFRRYLRFFRANRFDVIHVHFSPDILVAAWTARLARAGTVVFSRHVAEPWGRAKTALYLRFIDHLVPVSEAVREVLIAGGVPEAKMSMAAAGCAPLVPTVDRAEMRRLWDLDGFTVGVFGRLVREKGIDVAIEASAKINCPFEVFGDGPLRSELEEQARSHRAPVHFRGFQEGVADAMNAVDVVAIPSRWAEAFSFATVEAMSLGKPVIGVDAGGVREIIENGRTGLLFRREDPDDLARKVEELRSSPEKMKAFGEASIARHRDMFTVQHMSERMEAVYRAVAKSVG